MRPDIILWISILIPFLACCGDPDDCDSCDDDIYAFVCSVCGQQCFDGDGDGETCDDCLYEQEF